MDIEHISTDKLNKAVAEALKHLDQAIDLLPFLLSLTSEQRQHSSGKLRSGEPVAMERAVLNTVAEHPAPFATLKLEPKALSDLPARRETGLARQVIQRAEHLAEDLADTLLHLGEAVKTPTAAAYHVGVALAPHDTALAHDLQPAVQFYQSMGRQAARTRHAHKATPAAK